MVRTDTPSSRPQKAAGGVGRAPMPLNTSPVANSPTTRTAAADASNSTHAIARGGRAARWVVSSSRTSMESDWMVFPGGYRSCRALANLANDIGRLVLRFVVRPRLQFGKEAERDQLNAREHQQDGKQQERA